MSLRHRHHLVGDSPAILDTLRLVDAVAQSDCAVLIEGESGTGKELIARRLHANSPRHARPFIPVNCAGVGESLFESQFFGHVKGAFTGAEQSMLGMVRTAEQGTLFLDEVGEVPLNLQPKLLRVLQEQEVTPVGTAEPILVDVRFIAATNRSLRDMVTDGTFREDLFYRLNIVRIEVPPLRDRLSDVPLLLEYFSDLAASRQQREPVRFDRDVVRRLCEYAWPGNVRELASWVERVYATRLDPRVLLEMLHRESRPAALPSADEALPLREAERRAILQAMDKADNNQRQAAALLQIHRHTLSKKLRDFGISP